MWFKALTGSKEIWALSLEWASTSTVQQGRGNGLRRTESDADVRP